MFEAGGGRIGCDAGNGFPNPFTYASIGIMIEAVHATRSHSFVYHIAVPPFPDGGGSIVHRIQPAWVLTLKEEFIGNVFHAILREGGHENGCAQESGLQAKIVLCEVFTQAVYHLRFGFAFHKLVL